MKLTAFDFNTASWDEYKRFHRNLSGGFVQFSTGEVIATLARPRPCDRGEYFGGSVRVVLSSDAPAVPVVYHKGEKVPLAWLNQGGGQYLVVDMTQRRVYALSYIQHQGGEGLPGDLRRHRVAMYWPGEGLPPVASPFGLSRPVPRSDERAEHMRQLRAACVAWHAMRDFKPTDLVSMPVVGGRRTAPRQYQSLHFGWSWPALMFDEYDGKAFGDLSDYHRIILACNGVPPMRDVEEVPFLALDARG